MLFESIIFYLNILQNKHTSTSLSQQKVVIPGIKDILVDSCLHLWNKCKNHYSRVTSYSVESFKAALQDPYLEKVFLLHFCCILLGVQQQQLRNQ